MTIEELSIVATDQENFSHVGNVLLQDTEGNYYEPKGVVYDTTLASGPALVIRM